MSAKIAYDALIHPDRVHGSLYIDPAIFKDEMENIFHKGWVFVGHVSEVPNVGDFARRQIGRQPVLILHTPRDGVKLFLNRCTHR